MNRSHKSEIEAIRTLVTAVGGVCNVLHQVGRLRGSAGIPDLYAQLPKYGKAIWIEVKVGRDRPRPEQADFMLRERACGGAVIVGGVEEVIAELKLMGVKVG